MTYLNFNGAELEVGKIVCLLRSYAAHAEEMGSVLLDEPDFFLKPPTTIIRDGQDIIIPKESNMVHHEVELAVIIGKEGHFIPKEHAMKHVLGYSILIDVTARDIQAQAKKDGRPWTVSKGFDTFAPMSSIVPKSKINDPYGLDIWLKVNGEYRQKSNTSLLLFKISEIITSISKVMTLEPGDIIATGTPEGVSQIVPGDTVEAGIDGLGTLNVGVQE
ncbi:MAG: fumarylacetoacetate hydrolase family protein [Thermoplasmata archaeon]|nr:fumarylacetoacetate hydrolase family protein [Thermoplasmata archaeon]